MKNGRYEDNDGVGWYLNDLLHREDGPAIEAIGYDEWYQHGLLHREDGPAVESWLGEKLWFLNGSELTEEEFNQWLEKKHLNEKLQNNFSPRLRERKKKI